MTPDLPQLAKRDISVRRATTSDAVGACDTVCRSIRHLCIDDHRNDETTLSAWLGNKTTARFERWISDELNSCVVAVRGSDVCGYGQINRPGEVVLLYVAPQARFLGASTLMLQWLEEQAAGWGARGVFLNSSLTARQFYERRGYVQNGEAVRGFGLASRFPMIKALVV